MLSFLFFLNLYSLNNDLTLKKKCGDLTKLELLKICTSPHDVRMSYKQICKS